VFFAGLLGSLRRAHIDKGTDRGFLSSIASQTNERWPHLLILFGPSIAGKLPLPKQGDARCVDLRLHKPLALVVDAVKDCSKRGRIVPKGRGGNALPVYLHMAVEGVAQGTDKLRGCRFPACRL